MEVPIKPSEEDCCNSGCNPCIFDVYERKLKIYKSKLSSNNSTADSTLNCKNCLLETAYSLFKLVKHENHTENSYIFTFEFVKFTKDENHTNRVVLFKPGQHFMLRHDNITRAYTPVDLNSKNSKQFIVLIKLYPNGVMSKYLKALKINDLTLWRGPYGDFELRNILNSKYILFIAQGTGITPLFTIIKKLLENEECLAFLKLLFCCSSGKEILLRDHLYEFSSNWNFTYEVFVPRDESFLHKYKEVINFRKLNLEDLQQCLQGKQYEETKLFICGSENFNSSFKNLILNQIHLPEACLYIF